MEGFLAERWKRKKDHPFKMQQGFRLIMNHTVKKAQLSEAVLGGLS